MSAGENLAYSAPAPTAYVSAVADAPAPIARRARVGEAAFRSEYLLPRVPLVFADLAREWPLFHRATPDDFRRRFGAHAVRMHGRRIHLGELLDRLQHGVAQPYPCRIDVARDLPALLPDITPRFAQSVPDRQGSALMPPQLAAELGIVELSFAAAGARSQYLACDALGRHRWIAQLYGEQEITLFAPGQEAFLYPDPTAPWQSRMRRPHAPDAVRYALFRNASAQRVLLAPGETLFVPSGWWHSARSTGFSIGVAFGQLGADNWPDFVAASAEQRLREGKPAAARAWRTHLALLGASLAVLERFRANRALRWCRR